MATALHRSTLELRHSVDPTELPGDPADWLVQPDLSALEGVPKRYWKLVGESVMEMTAEEKAAVDAAELAGAKRARIALLRDEADAFVAGVYPSSTRELALALYAEAIAEGYTQRRAGLEPLFDLGKTTGARFRRAMLAVDAAQSVDQVESVELDLSGIELPEVDVTALAELQE